MSETFPSIKDGGGPLDVGASAFWVGVCGPVRSKSNYRNSKGSDWKEQASYSRLIAALLRANRPNSWVKPDRGLAVSDRPYTVGVLVARTTLDAGNLSKSVLDAGEGVLWVSDAEIRTVCESVERTRTNPGLVAAFAQLEGKPNSQEQLHTCLLLHAGLVQAQNDLA